MSHPLLLPEGVVPTNLHLPNGGHTYLLESDMYNICERIKELDPELIIVVHEHPGGRLSYVIMEPNRQGTGGYEMVKRYHELDGRVIEDLRYMLSVPFEKRFDEKVAEIDKSEADRKEADLDELYERVGGPMRYSIARDLGNEDLTNSHHRTNRAARRYRGDRDARGR